MINPFIFEILHIYVVSFPRTSMKIINLTKIIILNEHYHSNE